MTPAFLNCLHESQLLLDLAQKGDWDAFIERHSAWSHQVDDVIQSSPKDEPEGSSIRQLLNDVDEIRSLIRQRMNELESQVSSGRQQKQAVKQYLK
jgi:hypothetical protein